MTAIPSADADAGERDLEKLKAVALDGNERQ
jgi:hypothetical protein